MAYSQRNKESSCRTSGSWKTSREFGTHRDLLHLRAREDDGLALVGEIGTEPLTRPWAKIGARPLVSHFPWDIQDRHRILRRENRKQAVWPRFLPKAG